MKLTDREWREFEVRRIFDVVRGNAKDISKRNMMGNIGLVSATDKNNAFYGETIPTNNETIYKNCLTIHNNGNGVGLSFFHQYSFIATSDVTILLDKTNRINAINSKFIIPILQKQKPKYSYGYKLSNPRLEKQKIMIPVNEQNEPDYEFMEDYIKEKENKMISKYITYLESRNPLGGVTTDVKIYWKEFNIKDIFDFIDRGKRLKKKDHIAGNIPYVSSTMFNNGVDGFIGNENGKVFTNCLSIANSGSVGYCFYHQYKYIASDHVTGLKNTKYNKWIYLYLSTIVSRISSKYSFNREINDFRIKKEKIMLPIKEDGNIDFEYMENYSKNIIKEKIEQYLTYKQIACLKN